MPYFLLGRLGSLPQWLVLDYSTLDIYPGPPKPTTNSSYASSLVVLVTDTDHTLQMWLGSSIKCGVPVIIGFLHLTRSPTNTHLTYYLGTKLSRYLVRGISAGHLHTSSYVMMELCPCSPRKGPMPSMMPLILYRLHSSEQLVEGTCLFLIFPPTIPWSNEARPLLALRGWYKVTSVLVNQLTREFSYNLLLSL